MATNHFCESYGSNHIIRTKASNIELVSFYKGTEPMVLFSEFEILVTMV